MPEADGQSPHVGQGSAIGHNSGTQNNYYGDSAAAAAAKAARRPPTTNFTDANAHGVAGFVGRERELTEIHGRLMPKRSLREPGALAISQAVAGEGGIGKSALARRYAQVHGE